MCLLGMKITLVLRVLGWQHFLPVQWRYSFLVFYWLWHLLLGSQLSNYCSFVGGVTPHWLLRLSLCFSILQLHCTVSMCGFWLHSLGFPGYLGSDEGCYVSSRTVLFSGLCMIMFYIWAVHMVTVCHLWLTRTWNVVSVTEELCLNFNFSSHMWLMATL